MNNPVTLQKIVIEKAIFMAKVYAFLAFALLTTAYSAISYSRNFVLANAFRDNPIGIFTILIIEFGIVFWLSVNFKIFSSLQISIFLFLYSILNGITISMIFQFISGNFQIDIFFILTGMFLIMCAIYYFSKLNFTFGIELTLMLICGFGINIVVNMIWRNDVTQLITAGIGVIIFTGLVAYNHYNENQTNETEEPILKAFKVYINLFYLFIAVVLEANKGSKRSTH